MTKEQDVTSRPLGGDLNAAIARAVVRRHVDHVGRGPTRAQAFHLTDVVVVLLEDALTKAEQALLAAGEERVVREVRAALHEAMRPGMIAAVEELTGASVRAFMATTSAEPDMAAVVFVLAATGGSG